MLKISGLACLASGSSNVSTQTEIIVYGRNLFRTGIKVNVTTNKIVFLYETWQRHVGDISANSWLRGGGPVKVNRISTHRGPAGIQPRRAVVAARNLRGTNGYT